MVLGVPLSDLVIVVGMVLLLCTTVGTLAMEAAVIFTPAFLFAFPSTWTSSKGRRGDRLLHLHYDAVAAPSISGQAPELLRNCPEACWPMTTAREARDTHGPLGLRGVVCLLLLGVAGQSPSTSWAESGPPSRDARTLVQRGTIEAGVATGFLQATTAIGAGPSANRSAVLVLPRMGMVLTDPLGTGWWQGNVEVLVEPLFARFVKPFAAEAAGGSLVVQYNFLSFGRWMPFWQAGAGMVWTNLAPRIPEQSAQFEFVLDTGPGVHYFMTETLTLTTAVRLHHLSNAGIGERNTGINAVLASVGLSVFLPSRWSE